MNTRMEYGAKNQRHCNDLSMDTSPLPHRESRLMFQQMNPAAPQSAEFSPRRPEDINGSRYDPGAFLEKVEKELDERRAHMAGNHAALINMAHDESINDSVYKEMQIFRRYVAEQNAMAQQCLTPEEIAYVKNIYGKLFQQADELGSFSVFSPRNLRDALGILVFEAERNPQFKKLTHAIEEYRMRKGLGIEPPTPPEQQQNIAPVLPKEQPPVFASPQTSSATASPTGLDAIPDARTLNMEVPSRQTTVKTVTETTLPSAQTEEPMPPHLSPAQVREWNRLNTMFKQWKTIHANQERTLQTKNLLGSTQEKVMANVNETNAQLKDIQAQLAALRKTPEERTKEQAARAAAKVEIVGRETIADPEVTIVDGDNITPLKGFHYETDDNPPAGFHFEDGA